MQENKIDFDQLKKEVGLVLDAFIRANETIAAITEFNDDLYDGTLLLEEAKALQRLIGGFSPDEETCDLIKATLTLIAKRCKSDGASVIAYEADALIDRLSHLQAAVSALV
jgi:hypothetical protein